MNENPTGRPPSRHSLRLMIAAAVLLIAVLVGIAGYLEKWLWMRASTWFGPEQAKYLNVARVDGPGIGPGGNATDFPIFCHLPNEQILEAFVQSVCAITGCRPRQMV